MIARLPQKQSLGWAASLLLVTSVLSQAWIPAFYSDPDLVERSELIVSAHVVAGSIKFLPYRGAQWGDYSLTLSIDGLLKGKCPAKELTVLIHYGLTPVIGGYLKEGNEVIDFRNPKIAKDTIQIVDTDPGMIGGPITDDARKNFIWFLRRTDPGYQYDAKNNLYGIFNSQDIQELALRPYFLALLSNQPDVFLRTEAKGSSVLAARARDSLGILTLAKISQMKDREQRCSELASFYLGLNPVVDRFLVFRTGRQILRDGPVALAKLVPVFNESRYASLRSSVIQLWGLAKYRQAGPRLVQVFNDPNCASLRGSIVLARTLMDYRASSPLVIRLLREECRFWNKQQMLNSDWWNTSGDQVCEERRNSYVRVYNCLSALAVFKDPAAKDAIQETKKLFERKYLNQNGQISDACLLALTALSASKSP